MKKLIALTGFAGAGKTTAAEILAANYNYCRLSFATPIKDMLKILGLNKNEVYGQAKDIPCSLLNERIPRTAMQTIGDWGKVNFGEDFWANLLKAKYLKLRSQGYSIVIDDLRFKNEARMVKELGGELVYIFKEFPENITHESERQVMEIKHDFVIVNKGSIKELTKNLELFK
jgi:hypothetical protein